MVKARSRHIFTVAIFAFSLLASHGAHATTAYTMPSVTVGYPNGGECIVLGSPVTISWTGTGYDHVSIAYAPDAAGAPPAYLSNPSAWNIAHPVTGTSYVWTSTASAPTGTPMRIWIEAEGPGDVMLAVDSSNMPFGFSSNCAPAITATSSTDTTAPSVPTGVTASALSSSSIAVSWAASTDNVGVTGYGIYRNGVFVTNVPSLSYQDSGLSSSTTYSYDIAAYDAVFNNSAHSNPASATTYAATTGTTTTTVNTDTTAPVFSNVRAENIIGSGAQIKWTTDDLSDSRVAYGTASGSYTLFSNGRCDVGGNVTDHCVNLTGLSPGMTYYYKTESLNVANLDGSSSGYYFAAASAIFTATTTPTATTTTTSTTTATSTSVTTTTATANFALDAQISGSIVDSSGQVISNASGYVSTYVPHMSAGSVSSNMTAMAFGGPIDKGSFGFSVPHGKPTRLLFISRPARYWRLLCRSQ